MIIDIIKRGTTSWRGCIIRIIDSTDGTPETGVVYNTSGIDLWYRREAAVKTSITEATLAAVDSAYSSGGIIHIGDGYYRLDLPDAALASSAGVNFVDVGGTVTGMVIIGGRVKLVDFDYNDAVRAGLTALPNAAAEASGGLYTRGTGAGQINQPANGRIDVNAIAQSGTTLTARDIGASVLLSSGTGTGQLDFTSGVVKANLAQILATALTETSGYLAAAFKKFFNVATPTGTVSSIPDAVAGAAGGLFIAGTNAATSVTTALTANVTGNLSGSVGSVTGAVGSVTGAVGSVTGAVGSVTGGVGGNVTGSVGSLATQAKADVNAEVVDALSTDTYAEPGQGAPAATASLAAKIGYLYKSWRNKKTQTSSQWSLFADDTTTVDQKATVSDDATTTTKSEIATGP